ncbi:unnamed protein product [Amoebophrya sp. A120]|nr:unnamed protein product [Amoebophrya sp. A120]|eukprot:GSA120T00007365001.1
MSASFLQKRSYKLDQQGKIKPTKTTMHLSTAGGGGSCVVAPALDDDSTTTLNRGGGSCVVAPALDDDITTGNNSCAAGGGVLQLRAGPSGTLVQNITMTSSSKDYIFAQTDALGTNIPSEIKQGDFFHTEDTIVRESSPPSIRDGDLEKNPSPLHENPSTNSTTPETSTTSHTTDFETHNIKQHLTTNNTNPTANKVADFLFQSEENKEGAPSTATTIPSFFTNLRDVDISKLQINNPFRSFRLDTGGGVVGDGATISSKTSTAPASSSSSTSSAAGGGGNVGAAVPGPGQQHLYSNIPMNKQSSPNSKPNYRITNKQQERSEYHSVLGLAAASGGAAPDITSSSSSASEQREICQNLSKTSSSIEANPTTTRSNVASPTDTEKSNFSQQSQQSSGQLSNTSSTSQGGRRSGRGGCVPSGRWRTRNSNGSTPSGSPVHVVVQPGGVVGNNASSSTGSTNVGAAKMLNGIGFLNNKSSSPASGNSSKNASPSSTPENENRRSPKEEISNKDPADVDKNCVAPPSLQVGSFRLVPAEAVVGKNHEDASDEASKSGATSFTTTSISSGGSTTSSTATDAKWDIDSIREENSQFKIGRSAASLDNLPGDSKVAFLSHDDMAMLREAAKPLDKAGSGTTTAGDIITTGEANSNGDGKEQKGKNSPGTTRDPAAVPSSQQGSCTQSIVAKISSPPSDLRGTSSSSNSPPEKNSIEFYQKLCLRLQYQFEQEQKRADEAERKEHDLRSQIDSMPVWLDDAYEMLREAIFRFESLKPPVARFKQDPSEQTSLPFYGFPQFVEHEFFMVGQKVMLTQGRLGCKTLSEGVDAAPVKDLLDHVRHLEELAENYGRTQAQTLERNKERQRQQSEDINKAAGIGGNKDQHQFSFASASQPEDFFPFRTIPAFPYLEYYHTDRVEELQHAFEHKKIHRCIGPGHRSMYEESCRRTNASSETGPGNNSNSFSTTSSSTQQQQTSSSSSQCPFHARVIPILRSGLPATRCNRCQASWKEMFQIKRARGLPVKQIIVSCEDKPENFSFRIGRVRSASEERETTSMQDEQGMNIKTKMMSEQHQGGVNDGSYDVHAILNVDRISGRESLCSDLSVEYEEVPCGGQEDWRSALPDPRRESVASEEELTASTEVSCTTTISPRAAAVAAAPSAESVVLLSPTGACFSSKEFDGEEEMNADEKFCVQEQPRGSRESSHSIRTSEDEEQNCPGGTTVASSEEITSTSTPVHQPVTSVMV